MFCAVVAPAAPPPALPAGLLPLPLLVPVAAAAAAAAPTVRAPARMARRRVALVLGARPDPIVGVVGIRLPLPARIAPALHTRTAKMAIRTKMRGPRRGAVRHALTGPPGARRIPR